MTNITRTTLTLALAASFLPFAASAGDNNINGVLDGVASIENAAFETVSSVSAITPPVTWKAVCVFPIGSSQAGTYAVYDNFGHSHQGVVPGNSMFVDRQEHCENIIRDEGCGWTDLGNTEDYIRVNVFMTMSRDPISPIEAPFAIAPRSIPWTHGAVRCLPS